MSDLPFDEDGDENAAIAVLRRRRRDMDRLMAAAQIDVHELGEKRDLAASEVDRLRRRICEIDAALERLSK